MRSTRYTLVALSSASLSMTEPGRHVAEVLALGHYFRRNAGLNCICCFLDRFRVAVGESEFSENGMHFRGVLACYAENIHHFTLRILRIFRPVDNPDNGLVA